MLYNEVMEKYSDIKHLTYAISLLNWDQSTYMPKKGAASRADIFETVTKIAHDMVIEDSFYEKINALTGSDEFKTLDKFKQDEITKLKNEVERQRKIPTELAKLIAKTTSFAMHKWEEAKKTGDDTEFLPLLEKNFKLKKELSDTIGYEENPYDALLDEYDRGLKYSYIEPVFIALEKELIEIIGKIDNSRSSIETGFLFKDYDTQKQWDFGLSILKKMGLDSECFRQDRSVHPFTATLGDLDVRITTNITGKNFIKGFFSTLHEGGHCLYEISSAKALAPSPFAMIDSLSIHESQSRFFENIIGRSFEFWESNFPGLQKIFIENLKDVNIMDFYRAINKVQKSLIRIESDEVTYNLHIILRTQIENDLINGRTKAGSINEIWNEKTKKIFGFYPKSKSEGYLQDVHWSDGLIGYFPTYTMGNLISAQFFNAMKKDIGSYKVIDDMKLKSIFTWLNEKIYKYGSIYKSFELVKKTTGEALSHKYFTDYLKNKFYNIYS